MAIKLNHNGTNRVVEWHVSGCCHNTEYSEEYSVRFLGRGLWHVVRESDGYRWTLSTSRLQRFFRRWVSEPSYDYEELFYTVE